MSHTAQARALGVGAVAAAALLVAGCGSSSSNSGSKSAAASPSSGGTINGTEISRAADVSSAEKGEKVAYKMTESVPSLGNITMSGTGAFNLSPAQGQMSMKIGIPSSSSLGAASALLSNLDLNLVINKGVFYIQIPSSLSSELSSFTGGKQWVEIDLNQLAKTNSSLSGITSLLNGSNSPTNPSAMFKQMAAASTNGVQKVGTATVNGVQTTEYKATLDFSKLSSALPASEKAAMQKLLAQEQKALNGATMPITLYIDSSNLVRRAVYSFTTSVSGQKTSMQMQMDVLAYGQQPAPSVPAASETYNLDSLVSKGLSSAGSTAGSSSLFGG